MDHQRPWEHLPRPVLGYLCKYLSVEDKNNLRLTSTKLANTIPSVSKHYESGSFTFPIGSFEHALSEAESMLKKANVPTSHPEFHLSLSLSEVNYSRKIRFSKRLFKLCLSFNSWIADQLESTRSIIKSLHSKNVVRVVVEFLQGGEKFFFSDLNFSTLRGIVLAGYFHDYASEATQLIERFSRQLELLSIGDDARSLSINFGIPNLTSLHLNVLSRNSISILESCAHNLETFSTSSMEAFPGTSLKLPNLRTVKSWTQNILHLLPNCCSTLESVSLKSIELVDPGTRRDLVNRLQFSRLQRLCLDTGWGEEGILLIEKCCKTLQSLQIISDCYFDDAFDLQKAVLVFPNLRELTLVGDNSPLLNSSLPVLQVLRLDDPMELHRTTAWISQIKTLTKVVIQTSDQDDANFVRDRVSCQVEVVDNMHYSQYNIESVHDKPEVHIDRTKYVL